MPSPVPPFSVLDLAPIAKEATPRRRSANSARPGAARRAAGLPPLLARRAPQHARHRQRRDLGGHRARRRRHVDASGSARAASCSPTTRRWSSPSSSARWTRSTPGGSTSGSGARRGPTREPRTRCAATLAGDVDQLPPGRGRAAGYFGEPQPGAAGARLPGRGRRASRSGSSARACSAPQLAAALGLPFAFASHFAPALLMEALDVYRERFRPSPCLERPAASWSGSTSSSRRQRRRGDAPAHSLQQAFVNLRSGRADPPSAAAAGLRRSASPPQCAAMLDGVLACAVVGAPETVRAGSRSSSRAPGGRADRHRADPRPRRPPAELRPPGRGPGPARRGTCRRCGRVGDRGGECSRGARRNIPAPPRASPRRFVAGRAGGAPLLSPSGTA